MNSSIQRHLLAGKYVKCGLGQVGLDLSVCSTAGLGVWGLVWLILIAIIGMALEIQTDFTRLSN